MVRRGGARSPPRVSRGDRHMRRLARRFPLRLSSARTQRPPAACALTGAVAWGGQGFGLASPLSSARGRAVVKAMGVVRAGCPARLLSQITRAVGRGRPRSGVSGPPRSPAEEAVPLVLAALRETMPRMTLRTARLTPCPASTWSVSDCWCALVASYRAATGRGSRSGPPDFLRPLLTTLCRAFEHMSLASREAQAPWTPRVGSIASRSADCTDCHQNPCDLHRHSAMRRR